MQCIGRVQRRFAANTRNANRGYLRLIPDINKTSDKSRTAKNFPLPLKDINKPLWRR